MEISLYSLQLIACHDPLLIFTLSSQIGNLGIKHIHILKHLIRQGYNIDPGWHSDIVFTRDQSVRKDQRSFCPYCRASVSTWKSVGFVGPLDIT